MFSVGPVAEGMHDMQTNSNSDSKIESKLKEFYVGSIEGIGASWQQSLSTNARMIQYKLDTGAQVNILPYSIYQQLSPRPPLHKVSAGLFAYGTVDPISVKGQCICNIGLQHGGSRQPRFYVLEAGIHAVPLLGLQACDQLSLVRRVAATAEDTEDDSLSVIRVDEVAKDYLDLFRGFGAMTELSYKMRLVEWAEPYSLSTARRIPYHMYGKVEEEWKRMVQLGVIKPVSEPTEWCSPMVIVPKKNGEVRICADYTRLNRSIKWERFQLSPADKIFAKIKSARFFTTWMQRQVSGRYRWQKKALL